VNSFSSLPLLRNTYFLVRHALARSNTTHTVVSDITHDDPFTYSLAPPFGPAQASLAGTALASLLVPMTSDRDRPVVIVASDFSRTRQTAEIIRAALVESGFEVDPIRLDPRLRERVFGARFELGDSRVVARAVWPGDARVCEGRDSEVEGVEDWGALRRRMEEFVLDWEGRERGRNVIIVSHGDPLEALSAVFEGQCQSALGKGFYKNAEVRKATASGDKNVFETVFVQPSAKIQEIRKR